MPSQVTEDLRVQKVGWQAGGILTVCWSNAPPSPLLGCPEYCSLKTTFSDISIFVPLLTFFGIIFYKFEFYDPNLLLGN
jgi:hypothetical protein